MVCEKLWEIVFLESVADKSVVGKSVTVITLLEFPTAICLQGE